MWLSIGSVVIGYLVMAFIVMIGTIAATALMIPGGFAVLKNPNTTPPAAYLYANLIVSFAAALVGGWLTARMAIHSPMMHAAALAAIMLVMSVVSAQTHKAKQPAWYPWTISVLGVTGVLLGGWWRVHSI